MRSQYARAALRILVQGQAHMHFPHDLNKEGSLRDGYTRARRQCLCDILVVSPAMRTMLSLIWNLSLYGWKHRKQGLHDMDTVMVEAI